MQGSATGGEIRQKGGNDVRVARYLSGVTRDDVAGGAKRSSGGACNGGPTKN